MPNTSLSKLHLCLLVVALAATGCDSELAPSPLLLRTAQAQAANPQPAQPLPAPVPDAAPAAEVSGSGPAALHSYREDVDPGHAAIASYRD